MILLRYLTLNYLLGCLPVLLTLGSLFSFLALAEELEDVGKGFYQTRDALLVTLLTLPNRLLELLPVTLLLGGLFGLGTLARHHEIVVLRASGLSPAQLARPLMAVAAAIILMVVALRIYVIPGLELQAVQLRAKTEATEIARDQEGSGYWIRTGNQLLHIDQLVDGRQLKGIEIYHLDNRERVVNMIHARRGNIVGDQQWLLQDVEQFEFRQSRLVKDTRKEMQWSSQLTDQQTASLVVPIEALSTLALYRYIRLLEAGGLDSQRYKVIFWQQLSQLLALLIMALLSLPFVLKVQRSGGLAGSAVIGGVLGIGFYLLEQLMGHFSILLDLPPLIAAMAPETLMVILAIYLLYRTNLN